MTKKVPKVNLDEVLKVRISKKDFYNIQQAVTEKKCKNVSEYVRCLISDSTKDYFNELPEFYQNKIINS